MHRRQDENKHALEGGGIAVMGKACYHGDRILLPVMHVVKAEQQLDEPIENLDFRKAPSCSSHLLQFTVQIPILMGGGVSL